MTSGKLLGFVLVDGSMVLKPQHDVRSEANLFLTSHGKMMPTFSFLLFSLFPDPNSFLS